jgi:lambda family phage minor tail protein L
MSTDPVFSEVQKINPSAIIELFVLELSTSLHGTNTGIPISNNENNIYRFHSGSNLNANGEIVWATKKYARFPVEATGFAYQRGQIPRPKLVVSNALGTISTILLTVNQTTTGNDLTGATVTRIRTMARFLDSINFPGNSNPLGTPDPTAEFKRQIYKIDRKATENREIVEFELAGSIDMAGVRAPKRQCTRALFPSIGTFNQ